MAVELLEIDVPSSKGGLPITLGISMGKRFGLTHVNLFALEENEGPVISDNLLSVARYITGNVLPGTSMDALDWTLTAGYRTSSVNFTTLNGAPFKIDVSDRHTLEHERARLSFPLERYNRDFAGHPPRDVSHASGRGLVQSPYPMSVFTIPCSHPAAKEGVFHCHPSYYDAEHMRDGYEFILADTKKTIAQLRRYEPAMLEHADRKFAGDNAEDWLKGTSMEYPRDMGTWDRNLRDGGVTMSSGQAGMIRLVQELNLPFFPIATSKSWGERVLNEVRNEIGYMAGPVRRDLPMRPTYSTPGYGS